MPVGSPSALRQPNLEPASQCHTILCQFLRPPFVEQTARWERKGVMSFRTSPAAYPQSAWVIDAASIFDMSFWYEKLQPWLRHRGREGSLPQEVKKQQRSQCGGPSPRTLVPGIRSSRRKMSTAIVWLQLQDARIPPRSCKCEALRRGETCHSVPPPWTRTTAGYYDKETVPPANAAHPSGVNSITRQMGLIS